MANKLNITSKVVSGISLVGISSVVDSGITVLKVSILTRLLEKSDFGLLAICTLLIAFSATFTDMGISAAVLHKQNIGRRVYSSLFWFCLIAGICASLILCACTPLIVASYHDTRLWCLVPLSTFDLIFRSITTLQRYIAEKSLNFKLVSFVQISACLIGGILSVFFALNGLGVYALLLSQIITSGITASFFIYYGIFIRKTIGWTFVFSETLPFLRIGVFRVGSGLLYCITNNCDSILISLLFPLETLGVYSLCKNLVMHLYAVMRNVVTVFTPFFALYQNQKEKLTEFFCQSLRSYAWVGFPVYTFVAIASDSILQILYGKAYAQYWYFLAVISLTYAMHSIQGLSGALALAYGKTNWILYWEIFAAAVSSITISVVGYLTHSITILIWAIFFFWFLTIVYWYPFFIVKRLLPISWLQYWRTWGPVVVLLLPLTFVYFLIRHLNPVLGLLFGGFLFVGLYLGGSCIFYRKEISLFTGIIQKMVKKVQSAKEAEHVE